MNSAEKYNEKIKKLGTEPIGKLLWSYSLPAIVGLLVMSIYNIVDRIFIGQGVGPDAIAGLAITFPVMNISSAIGMLVGAGAAARTSIVLGQNDKNKAHLILGNSLVMTLIFGSIYLLFFTIFIDDILMLFGASENTLPYAHDFMLYLMPGMLFMNLTFSLNNVMRASGYPKQAMFTMFIGAVLNVILEAIAIFVLDLGIIGAAIATDISMAVSFVFVLAHFCSKKSGVRFRRGIYRLKWNIIISIVSIGMSPFLINITGSAVNAIVNNTLYKYGGDTAVGAMGIVATYVQFLVMIVIGLCQGMQPIIGYNYGARRYDRLRRTYWLTVIAASVVTSLGAFVSLCFPHLIARAFTVDLNLIATASNGLHLQTIVFWIVGFQIVSTNFFQSLGMAKKSIFLSLSRQVIFLIPMVFILPTQMGLDGVWLASPVGDVLATLTTAFMIHYQFKKIKISEHTIEPYST